MKLHQYRSIVYDAGDAKTQKPAHVRQVVLVIETSAWMTGADQRTHQHLVLVLSVPLARKIQCLLRRSARRQELRAAAAAAKLDRRNRAGFPPPSTKGERAAAAAAVAERRTGLAAIVEKRPAARVRTRPAIVRKRPEKLAKAAGPPPAIAIGGWQPPGLAPKRPADRPGRDHRRLIGELKTGRKR